MVQTEIQVPFGYTEADIRSAVLSALPMREDELLSVRVLHRTLICSALGFFYRMKVGLTAPQDKETGLLKMRKKVFPVPDLTLHIAKKSFSARPVVVGSGPCGLFAAWVLAKAGARPILIERGDPVDIRMKKVEDFRQTGRLDTESNVQFGEGGAGTFSDGKLKIGSMDAEKYAVLSAFVAHGAPQEILYDGMPHVGTDLLPGIILGLRKEIELLGGQVRFRTKLTDIQTKDGVVTAAVVETENGREILPTDAVFLATGHSARDVFDLLKQKNIPMEAKGFGMGVRIEHPRRYVRDLVYGKNAPETLPEASYHLVCHLPNGRSVYSFCMCPGGTVVAAASQDGGIVTNGMSAFARHADNSNAALLVSVTPDDFGSSDVLAGVRLQEQIEKKAYSFGTEYRAPAIRLGDFLQKRESTAFGETLPSYPRGTVFSSPDTYLPWDLPDSLRAAMVDFEERLPGFASYADAVLTGPETRSTSPVRVLRETQTLTALGVSGLYPCGEGAGYAGGIVSSATDGIRAAEAYIAARQET